MMELKLSNLLPRRKPGLLHIHVSNKPSVVSIRQVVKIAIALKMPGAGVLIVMA
jgi:hypothetical protein